MKKNLISQSDRVSQIKEVLGQYSICFSDKGIQSNLDAYCRNKRGLIAVLRKHPCWNEDAMAVILEVTASREIDISIVSDCKDKLCGMLSDLRISTGDEYDKFSYGLRNLLYNPDKLLPVNESMKNDLQRECGFAYIAGQKTSKAINKFCRQFRVNEHTEYETVFAKLADALNPLSIPRKAVLSVHPCDYLQMSGSQNSWTSCHNIGDGGCANGTLSYMNDAVSMIFYTVDSGNKDTPLYNQPKITRAVFCYHDGLLLQSRLYPKDSDTNQRNLDRMCVQNIFSVCLKKPNLWRLSRAVADMERYVHTIKNHLHYADYIEGYNFSLSYLKTYPEYPSMTIGHNACCLHCGQLLQGSGAVVCAKCHELARCADCGTIIEKKYAKMIDGRYYCHHCIAFCDQCERSTPVRELSIAYLSLSEQINVCKTCRNSEYFQCAKCGEYHAVTNRCKHGDLSYCSRCYAGLETQPGTQEGNVVEFPDDMRRAS